MKKLISVFLIAAMLASSITVSAFAVNSETVLNTYDSLIEESPDITDNTDSPDNPEDPDIPEDPDAIIATVTLCSDITSPVSGHTWLYFENLSDEPILVGLYELPAGQGVSVGVFGFSARDGWGIYYNLECYRRNRDNKLDNFRTITRELNREKLENISDEIADYVNYWDLYFNCAFFAFAMWNSTVRPIFIPLCLPMITSLEMVIQGAKKGGMQMYNPTPDQVFRQKGSKGSARLEPVSEKTLNR